MASYSVNPGAVARARRLIDAISTDSTATGATSNPPPTTRTASWSHTRGTSTPSGISVSPRAPNDHTKARYGFVYGDFRRVHRMGLIACRFRAAEWQHKEVEIAAHELLQRLDDSRA